MFQIQRDLNFDHEKFNYYKIAVNFKIYRNLTAI